MRRPLGAAKALHHVPLVRALGTAPAGLERVPDVAADALPAIGLLRVPSAEGAANAPFTFAEPGAGVGVHDPGDVVGASASLAETAAVHPDFVAAAAAASEPPESGRALCSAEIATKLDR